MSNELPYLPFFVSDFLVAVGTWPADRVGAYTLALCYQFEHGGLPADDERELSRIMHTSRPVTRRLWLEIGAKFQRHDDGLWWNPRLEEVRAVAREQVAKASGRGRKGAAARWGKGANSSLSITQALPEHCLSNAQAMPIKVNTSTTPSKPPASLEASRLAPETQAVLTEILTNDLGLHDRDTATAFHDAIEARLIAHGWTVAREVKTANRGDGYAGYLDLLVTHPAKLAIELDRSAPRQKSLAKLRALTLDGYAGVVVCREGTCNWRWSGSIAVYASAVSDRARQAAPTRHVSPGDEQRRKTHEVQELIASGLSREDATRRVFK